MMKILMTYSALVVYWISFIADSIPGSQLNDYYCNQGNGLKTIPLSDWDPVVHEIEAIEFAQAVNLGHPFEKDYNFFAGPWHPLTNQNRTIRFLPVFKGHTFSDDWQGNAKLGRKGFLNYGKHAVINDVSKNWLFQHQVIPGELHDPDDITCADLNNDGLLDIIVDTDGMAWYENLGGDLPRWKIHKPIDPEKHGNMGIWTGDFDGDGDIDITGGQQGGDGNYWYENTGQATNWPVHFIFNMDDISDHSRVHDFNNDGKDDIIVQAYHGGGTYYLPSPEDPKKPWKSYKIGGKSAGLAIYDVDRDGDMDVLNSNVWYENMGNPEREIWPVHVVPNSSEDVKCDAGDINGDGITDFAHAEEEGNVCYVILSPNNTRINLKSDGNGLHTMKLEDFDKDGDLDLITADIHGGRLYIFENADGKGINWVNHIQKNNSPEGVHNCWTGDFNADGLTDIFGKHYNTGSKVEIWYNNLR